MKNRDKVIEVLEKGPKSYVDLKEEARLENGVLQHHIKSDERIVERADAVMLRNECEDCVFDWCDSCIKTKMEKPKKRKIAQKVDKGKMQSEIAEELNLSKATINYHVKDLRESNILENGKLRKEVKLMIEKEIISV